MQTFVWNARYETGILRMDTQHRRLVDLINGLGDRISQGELADLDRLYAALLDYALVHFSDEESLMAEHRLAPEVMAQHHESHVQFVRQIEQMKGAGKVSLERVDALNRFLASWLILHILGEDMDVARRMLAASGAQRLRDAVPQSDSEAAMLAAFLNLQDALSKANSELQAANADLENRVAERTRALQDANAELLAQRDELQALLTRLESVQLQLLQKEKMASVGQLAAGVAHEINNPIGFVSSNLTMLGEYSEDLLAIVDAYATTDSLIARDPHALAMIHRIKMDRDLDFLRGDLKTLLAESRDGLRRVTRIVDDLKDFSRLDDDSWQTVDLHTGLNSTINIVLSEVRQKAELRREYGDLPPLRCHPGQLNQVFMNLLINAAQAIEQHGLIIVRTGSADGWGWVEFCDNGCGIPGGQLSRIFEPFFTTKPIGEGTGLGLSMSYSIVHNHSGRIEVSSTVGQGSCFRVCLPLMPAVDSMVLMPAVDSVALNGQAEDS